VKEGREWAGKGGGVKDKRGREGEGTDMEMRKESTYKTTRVK
jgi:hypothetical protein